MDMRIFERVRCEMGRMSKVNTPGNEADVGKKGANYHSIQLSYDYITLKSLAYCSILTGGIKDRKERAQSR